MLLAPWVVLSIISTLAGPNTESIFRRQNKMIDAGYVLSRREDKGLASAKFKGRPGLLIKLDEQIPGNLICR